MNKLTRFFWFCSGAHHETLEKLPTEKEKFIGIGASVFFTGVLASLSSGYALFSVFDSWLPALFFGLLWGLMIFNLDRFIVSSMKKRGNAWQEWKMALPRLVFAVFLALVISKPLELKIFDKEIQRKLDERKTLMLAESKKALEEGFGEIADLKQQKAQLATEIEVAVAFRDKKQQEYDWERFGTKTEGTSGLVGLGSNAKKKEQQLDAAQRELDMIRQSHQQRMDTIDTQIRKVEAAKSLAMEKLQPNIDGFGGLAAQLDALHVLTEESVAIYWANLAILLLFVALETAPIFVKLISPRGPYDEILEMKEEKVEVYAREKRLGYKLLSQQRLKVTLAGLETPEENVSLGNPDKKI